MSVWEPRVPRPSCSRFQFWFDFPPSDYALDSVSRASQCCNGRKKSGGKGRRSRATTRFRRSLCLRQKSVRVALFCHSGLFRLVFFSHLRIPPQCGWRSDFGSRRSQQMTMLIGQEKQRISERLERLVAEREKLSAHFNELEIA